MSSWPGNEVPAASSGVLTAFYKSTAFSQPSPQEVGVKPEKINGSRKESLNGNTSYFLHIMPV